VLRRLWIGDYRDSVPRFERRSPVGQALTKAFLDADGPLCFEDLIEAVDSENAVAEVSAWVGHAMQARFIEEAPDASGLRCYRLKSRGLSVLGAEKRRRRIPR
jgi:hypothetical protein